VAQVLELFFFNTLHATYNINMGICGSTPPAEQYLALAQPECPDPLMPDLPRAMLMNPWPLLTNFGNTTNDPAGNGPPSTLSLTDVEGALLATIHMPPRRSFGIGASVDDASGNPVAWLRTAERQRPQGINRSSYNIFGPRPQVQGQKPTVIDKVGKSAFFVGDGDSRTIHQHAQSYQCKWC
jgi:hypothetical protein